MRPGWPKPAILCFAFATLIELLAYSVPWVDHGLDLLMTPLAVAVGSMLTATFLGDVQDPLVKYGLAIVFGGGAAGLMQGTTALGRLLSTKLTGGMANPVFSIVEALSSFTLSLIAIFLPLVAVGLVVILIAVMIWRFRKSKQQSHEPQS